jgi:VCBS repeat-containing protein
MCHQPLLGIFSRTFATKVSLGCTPIVTAGPDRPCPKPQTAFTNNYKDPEIAMNRSMTLKIKDASTESGYPDVWLTITESGNGTLSVQIDQDPGVIGDLRGFFFDVADESLIGSLSLNTPNKLVQGNDSVKNLGSGVTIAGLLGSDGGYDAGFEIGTSGIGKDDIRSFSFTLSSSLRSLTLDDFANVDFGVRLTSVGLPGSSRNGSSKILETSGTVVDAVDDAVYVYENDSTSGNVLDNDTGNANGEVSWQDGGSALLSEDGLDLGNISLGTDGSWLLEANGADVDQLSHGEQITLSKTFNYSVLVRETGDSTSWSTDSASLTVTIIGVNDGPVAEDDLAGSILEDAVLNGSVTANDTDIDRLDTHTFALVDNSFNGTGELLFNEDGTFSFDPQGNYDYLNEGEQVTLSFEYTMTDNHGASDTATVTFTVVGKGVAPPPPPPPPEPAGNYFPAWAQDISHITLVFEETPGDVAHGKTEADGYYTVKVDNWGDDEPRDVDDVISNILANLDAREDVQIDSDTELLGVIIKGGLQITAFYAYGDNDSNGETADVLPVGIALGLTGGHDNEINPNQIDYVISYGDLMIL